MTYLTTSRLHLRSLALTDAADLSALMTPAISRWLTNFRVPFSEEDAVARIRRIGDAEATGRASVFAFEQKNDAALVGWFGCTSILYARPAFSATGWGRHIKAWA